MCFCFVFEHTSRLLLFIHFFDAVTSPNMWPVVGVLLVRDVCPPCPSTL